MMEGGQVIDGFVLQNRIVSGGMGTVWNVTHPDFAEPLVMKFPLLRYGDDPAGIVGFEVEQMILPLLQGPHSPRFHAAGDFSRQPYLVMERIPGESLVTRLSDAPLPLDEVISIATRVATALHDLHRQHVIHLDLKPSNIMFRETGEAVLIDYGFARHDKLPDLLAEEFRLPLGTRTYISPEQLLRIRDEPRSDIFSLGILMYHLLTGQRPFGDPATTAGMRQRLWRDPLPPRALVPSCPPWLQELILHCLEVDPRARPETAARVAFDLQNPEQIPLGPRSLKLRRDGLLRVARRWLDSLGEGSPGSRSVSEHLSRAPIIVVAIDPGSQAQSSVDAARADALSDALRKAARRAMDMFPSSRLACVTVLKTNRLALNVTIDKDGNNLHVQRLVELKHWARPMELPAERLTYHVLEEPDPALALIRYARANQVDQIIIGARDNYSLPRFLNGVTARVVAQAGCSVNVVRVVNNVDTATVTHTIDPC